MNAPPKLPLDEHTLAQLNALPTYWVADDDALYRLIDDIDTTDQVALDTEFIRRNTYQPILALVQVNTGQAIYLVDAPRLDLTDLWQALAELPQMIWYACGEDLGIFYELSGCPPLTNVIDVQISLVYLTGNLQIGYSRAVSEVLGVNLSKTQSQSDWQRRPLSDEQKSYACDDVRYLLNLHNALTAALADKDLLSYAIEDSQSYAKELYLTHHTCDERQYLNYLSPTFDDTQVAVLQSLTAWREQLARTTNQPNSFILSKQALRDIVDTLPTNQKQLAQTSLNRASLRLYGKHIVELIKTAKTLPKSAQPKKPFFVPLWAEKTLKCQLNNAINEYSKSTKIPAVLVFKNRWLSELMTAVVEDDLTLITSDGLCGYRKAWIMATVIPILQGILDTPKS